MRFQLVWATLIVQSYSLVVSQIGAHEELKLPNSIEINQNRISLGVKTKIATDESLCIDQNGQRIHGLAPFRTDCRKYVQCGDGQELISSCTPGLLYNRVKKWCDWPRKAHCVEFKGKHKHKLVIPIKDWNNTLIKNQLTT